MTDAELIAEATAARGFAFAPYSNFFVGAAILSDDGRLFRGANVESASYGLTVCAERVALVKGVSEGARRFTRVAVVTAVAGLTPPCGACRQLLFEFAPDAVVLLANLAGLTERYTVRELLPRGFDADQLFPPNPDAA